MFHYDRDVAVMRFMAFAFCTFPERVTLENQRKLEAFAGTSRGTASSACAYDAQPDRSVGAGFAPFRHGSHLRGSVSTVSVYVAILTIGWAVDGVEATFSMTEATLRRTPSGVLTLLARKKSPEGDCDGRPRSGYSPCGRDCEAEANEAMLRRTPSGVLTLL